MQIIVNSIDYRVVATYDDDVVVDMEGYSDCELAWVPDDTVIDCSNPNTIPVPYGSMLKADLMAVRITEARREAERRISLGVLLEGIRFRCDDRSIVRLHGLLVATERMESKGRQVAVQFKTEAGQTVLIGSSAEVGDLFDCVTDHVAAVLASSSTLQDKLEGMTKTELQSVRVVNWEGWPA